MLTHDQQITLLRPYISLIAEIGILRDKISEGLVTWYEVEIDAERADLTQGFNNNTYIDRVNALHVIYQDVFQYSEFMRVYMVKDTALEFEEAHQITAEYYAGVELSFIEFKKSLE